MSTQIENLQQWLSSKAAALVSWLSAAMGIGTFMGLVNTVIGVLSACYLMVQLWNYFTHTRKKNRMELEVLRRKLLEKEKSAE